MNDPGYIFEIHVLSNSSSASITSELQVTAVRELNGVRVECFGPNGTMMYTINVASVGEFIMAIYTSNYNYNYAINLQTLQLLQVEVWQPISSSQKLEPQ
jgi:hypothetical protein